MLRSILLSFSSCTDRAPPLDVLLWVLESEPSVVSRALTFLKSLRAKSSPSLGEPIDRRIAQHASTEMNNVEEAMAYKLIDGPLKTVGRYSELVGFGICKYDPSGVDADKVPLNTFVASLGIEQRKNLRSHPRQPKVGLRVDQVSLKRNLSCLLPHLRRPLAKTKPGCDMCFGAGKAAADPEEPFPTSQLFL